METEGMEGMAVPSMPNVFFSFPDEGNRPSGTYVYVYVYVYIHVCVCVRARVCVLLRPVGERHVRYVTLE